MPQISQRMQFGAYVLISNIIVLFTVYPVVRNSLTFYSVGIQLSEGISIVILANWLVSTAMLLGKLLQKVLFGNLRPAEIENVLERSKMMLLNSLFRLMIFGNNYLLIPGVLLLFLVFIKVFHWILKDRFEYIHQHSTTARQYLATRNTLILFLFLYVDYCLVYSCCEYSFYSNPDVYFAFGFEFALLFIDMLHQLGKIVLNTWELKFLETHPEEEDLEIKTLYMKVLNMIHTSLQLFIRVFLLVTFVSPYRFPLYLFHDVLSGVISLVKQISELARFRAASKEMDSKLQDATQEDLNEDNNLCIICREDMTTEGVRKGERLFPKKLNCGHIIHMGCLKGWVARSQVCPMCRAPVFEQNQTSNAVPQRPQPQQVPQVPRETQEAAVPPPPQSQNIQQPLINHPPHVTGFFHSPLNHGPRTSTGSSTQSSSTLRLRPRSLIPPDWTLLKLTTPLTNPPEVRLNSSTTARITRMVQTPRIPQEGSSRDQQ